MAVTGLLLYLFVIAHLLGNLQIFAGPDKLNGYALMLKNLGPMLWFARIGLAAIFVLHVVTAIRLTRANRAARPVGYAASASGMKKTSFAARTAILSGALLLAFVVLHLQTFKYGTVYTTTVDGVEMRDIYSLVIEKFQEPGYVAWYLLSLAILGMHLAHGVKASFQSLGLFASNHPLLARIGLGFAILVAGGFITQPLAVFFFGLGG